MAFTSFEPTPNPVQSPSAVELWCQAGLAKDALLTQQYPSNGRGRTEPTRARGACRPEVVDAGMESARRSERGPEGAKVGREAPGTVSSEDPLAVPRRGLLPFRHHASCSPPGR